MVIITFDLSVRSLSTLLLKWNYIFNSHCPVYTCSFKTHAALIHAVLIPNESSQSLSSSNKPRVDLIPEFSFQCRLWLHNQVIPRTTKQNEGPKLPEMQSETMTKVSQFKMKIC